MSVCPRIIAHRCGGALAPENTLAGLEAVSRLDCRAVEFDVMLTADDVPVLLHDETLDRTTLLRGALAETPFAILRAGAPEVPTLAEAMEVCTRNDFWVNVEIKPSAGREEKTGAIVGAWLAEHWDGHGVISSFSEKSTLAARSFLPAAHYALLCDDLPQDWQATCARLGAAAVHLDADRITPGLAHSLNSARMRWAGWTVNDIAAADYLFALGASSIFSDRPDLWSINDYLLSRMPLE